MQTDRSARVSVVAAVVRDIPAGRVMSYGDVGSVAGLGPRQVGSIMAAGVDDAPWWRVVRSDGTLPDDLWQRAQDAYRAEGTPLRKSRVDMRTARWRPEL